MLRERRGAVLVLSLSFPAKRNALTRTMLSQLADAAAHADNERDASVRVVVLRGDPAGGCFSAGYDLSAIDDDERARGLDPIDITARALEDCPVPVIAAIDGPAFGGGLELAMACHMRIAATTSRFCMPPAKLGVAYSTSGLQRFLRQMRAAQVTRLFLAGEVFDGAKAAEIGLVEEIAAHETAFDASLRLAEGIAANAPLAVSAMHGAIRRLMQQEQPAALVVDELERARDRALQSADLVEGVAAFLEKRPPLFRGE